MTEVHSSPVPVVLTTGVVLSGALVVLSRVEPAMPDRLVDRFDRLLDGLLEP